MKKFKINYKLIIVLVILIVLFLPIILDYCKKQNITTISVSELKEKISLKESFLVYVGDLDKSTKRELVKMSDKTRNDYSYDYGVYSVAKSKEVSNLVGGKTKLIMYIEGDNQKIYTKYDYKNIDKDVDVYLVANINDDNRSYKVANNYAEYKKIVKSKKTVMSVFGRDSCMHCNRFKVVYNALASKYNLDIYFFDSDSYDAKQYDNILNMDLTVPAKCSQNNEPYKLANFTGTPLTIFTKKGKVIDCIAGYVPREGLLSTLKDVSMISE